MRIVTQAEMKDIERRAALEYQFGEALIVEQVGILGAQAIEERLRLFDTDIDLVVLVGRGNNGADGLALLRGLARPGRSVRAFVLFDEKDLAPETGAQLKRAAAYGAKIAFIRDMDAFEAYFIQNSLPKVVIDAIFGTGVRLPLSNFLHDVIHFVNANANYTIAMDIPTGVEGDTGLSQGVAIKADLTLTVAYPKVGHYVADGARLTGELHVLPVGFPQGSEGGDKFVLTRANLPYASDARSKFGDKKIFGHTLVVGGSHGLTGAAILAARAAARAGAGLVTVSTWENQYPEMVARLGPEIMTGFVPNDQTKWGKILQGLDKYDSLVIGPGLGRSARARRLVLEILNNFPGPLVLDADALNALSLKEDGQVFALRHAPTVMTPHFGEFARFCGLPLDEVLKSPVSVLKAAVERINCAVLLKGPCTFLGLANGKTYFNFHPNDGMATGGVGDVLAGILGGLLAQDTELKQRQRPLLQRYEHAHQASLLAVYLHTLAGQVAAETEGVRTMNAISVLNAMPAAFARLEGEGKT